MTLKMPHGFRPRFENFELVGFLDETMREGAERCPFSVPGDRKVDLAHRILRTGVRDIIFGSGPNDPANMAALVARVGDDAEVHADWTATFILLLNCWEPIYERFKSFPASAAEQDHIVISLAMLDYKSEDQLFEKVVSRFQALGFTKFRVSLLNNFKQGVDERAYEKLVSQIDRSVTVGIQVVRINDSLGEVFPETLAILAANLRTKYPDLSFCLHAHDDRGLGLQNALTSIYYGFDIIESAFSGFGNRSGLPAIETLNEIFEEKNITIRSIRFSNQKLIETAREVERTFLAVPSVYRPTSGMIVNWENMGVANIPDYLGSERNAKRFLNDVGLHSQTIERLMEGAETNHSTSELQDVIPSIASNLSKNFVLEYEAKRQQYDDVIEGIKRLYNEGIVFEDQARALVHKELVDRQTF